MKITQSKQYTLAILLNAIVMPGSGHFMLGYRIKGLIISLLTVTFIFVPLVRYTITLSEAMRAFSVKNPYVGNSLQALNDSWNINHSFIKPCLLIVFILWAYGIVDLLLMMKKKDTTHNEEK